MSQGIKTLDDIKSRCLVDETTDCWIWQKAFTGKDARAWYVDPSTGKGKVWQAGRLSMMLHTGKQPKPFVYRFVCNDHRCVNPDHMKEGSRHRMVDHLVKTGALKRSPETIAANIKTGRSCSSLDIDKVRNIRASTETHSVEARRYGVSVSTVSAIRLGKRWKETLSNSNIFNWRP